MGVFVGGANLELISQEKAETLMKDCTRAKDRDYKLLDLKDADYSEGKGSIPAPWTKRQAEEKFPDTENTVLKDNQT